MSAAPEASVLLLATGVAALLGWFFWFVMSRTYIALRQFSQALDARATKQRAALTGPIAPRAPAWLRALRVILVGTLVGLMAYLLAGKIEIR